MGVAPILDPDEAEADKRTRLENKALSRRGTRLKTKSFLERTASSHSPSIQYPGLISQDASADGGLRANGRLLELWLDVFWPPTTPLLIW